MRQGEEKIQAARSMWRDVYSEVLSMVAKESVRNPFWGHMHCACGNVIFCSWEVIEAKVECFPCLRVYTLAICKDDQCRAGKLWDVTAASKPEGEVSESGGCPTA